MTQPEKKLIQQLSGLQTAYAIRSACTNMPYVKCSEATVNDQVFLFESKQDALDFCAARREEGVPVTVQELVSQPLPEDPQGRVASQVRQFLAVLPTLDVDVVFYKGADMAQGQELYVADLLPETLVRKMLKSRAYNPLLQLTGIFFCQ